jgi:hypothetical protein
MRNGARMAVGDSIAERLRGKINYSDGRPVKGQA